MTNTFWTGPRPRILAHRGFVLHPETSQGNSFAAIDAALEVSADVIIETDIQATADGVAVLLHDPHFTPAGGLAPIGIRAVQASALPSLELPDGQTVPTLRDALVQYPTARFNIDIKAALACVDVAAAINDARAWNRVLLTSFSRNRRLRTTQLLERPVATSASSREVAACLTAASVRSARQFRRASARFDALQIPERAGRIRVVTPRLVRFAHAAGKEIHVWTVNEPATMARLVAMGVDGIVTDRPDLAYRAIEGS
ncbi:glycerophosphodiester phosphodiesterase family protein [Lysinibacter cavernae]|uniref:Glycerophosphoryl diester phosphodiesterase n=1 Tax=Lysinibacter cavernae TaxID=1640652 RepID=A0A7X5QZE7_9MICO|nr:glycerophosphodiester phosphodiesterase family protein [Lysinibacter cavernae]NIH52783.1 glycerophosphoryl diester phosphodiesterase [Lysinibacter cavernae]